MEVQKPNITKTVVETTASELTTKLIALLLLLLAPPVAALVPQVRDRILPVLPKPLLAVLVGISLSLNLALLFYCLRVRRQRNRSLAENARLQDLIDNPPRVFRFGVYWDEHHTPYCPSCLKPLTNYGNWQYGGWGFKCVSCKDTVRMHNDEGRVLELAEAKRLLSPAAANPEPETGTLDAPRKTKRKPDPVKVRHAINSLEVVRDNLPAGDIEEKYVNIYNNTLGDIAENVGGKVSDFFIPQSELKRRVASQRIGPRFSRHDTGPDITYSKERYCDRQIVLLAVNRAINHLKQRLLTGD